MGTLSARQRQIVIQLVNQHRRHQRDFQFVSSYSATGIEGGDFHIPAERADVEKLDDVGLLTAHWCDDHSAGITVEHEAYAAVRTSFGLTKRRFVLEAIYAISKANTNTNISEADIVEMTDLPMQELIPIIQQLAQEDCIKVNSRFTGITARGIEAAETPDPKPHEEGPATSTQITVHGGSVIFQTGDGSTASVVQTFGAAASELLPLIHQARESLHELQPEKRVEAADHLDDMENEIKSGRAKKSVLSGAMARLAILGMGAVGFVSSVDQIATKMEHAERTVIQMAHEAEGKP